ncbi:unnamed protein product, partial [Closterium sp. NIES-53]
ASQAQGQAVTPTAHPPAPALSCHSGDAASASGARGYARGGSGGAALPFATQAHQHITCAA